jgi:four helix bundle protein
MSFRRIEDIRSWHLAREFKRAIYALIDHPPLAGDVRLQGQLREAAAGPPAYIAEGFGRFDPADFARFVKMARASIVECRNHLIDAVDRGYITDDVRQQHDEVAAKVLSETAGLLDYLQSPEAKRNAERIRQKRIERGRNRRGTQNREPGTSNPEPES